MIRKYISLCLSLFLAFSPVAAYAQTADTTQAEETTQQATSDQTNEDPQLNTTESQDKEKNFDEQMGTLSKEDKALIEGDSTTDAAGESPAANLTDISSVSASTALADGLTLGDFMSSSNVFDSKLFTSVAMPTLKEESLSSMFTGLTGIEASSEVPFDTSVFAGNLDGSLMNMQYATLVSSLQDTAEATDVSGKSGNATSVFKDNYGNLAKKMKLKKAKIPKNFNTKKMMKSAKRSVNSAYASAMQDSTFKTVKSSVSVGNAFSEAQKHTSGNKSLSASDLKSDSALNNLIADTSKANKDKAGDEYRDINNENVKLANYYTQLIVDRKESRKSEASSTEEAGKEELDNIFKNSNLDNLGKSKQPPVGPYWQYPYQSLTIPESTK